MVIRGSVALQRAINVEPPRKPGVPFDIKKNLPPVVRFFKLPKGEHQVGLCQEVKKAMQAAKNDPYNGMRGLPKHVNFNDEAGSWRRIIFGKEACKILIVRRVERFMYWTHCESKMQRYKFSRLEESAPALFTLGEAARFVSAWDPVAEAVPIDQRHVSPPPPMRDLDPYFEDPSCWKLTLGYA